MASSSESGDSEDSGPDLMPRFRKIVNYKSRTSRQDAEMHRLARKLFKFEGLVEISPPQKLADPSPEPVNDPAPEHASNCVLHSDKATLPVRASAGAGGYDLSAAADYFISPGYLTFVALDCAVEIPVGLVGLVLPRSGLALRCSVEPAPGVIDSDYRGTICALLRNYGPERFEVRAGDRIAQLVIVPCLSRPFQCVPALSRTSRSGQGLGSTGVQPMSDRVERQPPSAESQGVNRVTEAVQTHRTSVQGATFQWASQQKMGPGGASDEPIPKRPKGNGPVCFYCGELGHIQKFCPRCTWW